MKVTLLKYTPDALETLLFTKQTRLKVNPNAMDEVAAWSDEKKMSELEYMLNTIKSSWEFIDYIFVIEDVTRAFTHQLVRHRAGTSFAQQAMRVVDMSGFSYETGDSIDTEEALELYGDGMDEINDCYQDLVSAGVKPQDARGILPTNIHTNIVFKANLRCLHDMAQTRLCVKAQGEFQKVFRAIKAAMIEVHPWTENMIQVACAATGVCKFPTVPNEDCHVKPFVFNPKTGVAFNGGQPYTLDEIKVQYASEEREIQPIVIGDDAVTTTESQS